MLRWCQVAAGWAAWIVLVCFLSGSHVARAADYSTTCGVCHGVPTKLLSQDPTHGIGIIIPKNDDGRFTGVCDSTTSFNCNFRKTLAASVSPMTGYATSLTGPELEAMRLYLIQVRDAETTVTASPTYGSPVLTGGGSADSTLSFTIKNFRSLPINFTLSNAGTSGFSIPFPADSTGSCAAATSTSGNTCSFSATVRFAPTGLGGPRHDDLKIMLTASDVNQDPKPLSPAAVPLDATAQVPTPGFNATPNPQSFTARANGPADTQTITITNPASATANLLLAGFTFSRSEYKRNASSSTCTTATLLTPGGPGCTLAIDFLPTAAGTGINGNVIVTYNPGSGSSTVALNGTGTQSTIFPVTSTVPFIDTQLGVPSAPQSMTVSNTGSATLNFAAPPVVLSGANQADYSFTTTCVAGTPLAPVVAPATVGGSCTIAVVFTPGAVAPPSRNATLTVSSDATNGPLVISLTGNGVALPPPDVKFPTTDFPDTVIGETSATSQQVTIKNARTRAITYTMVVAADLSKGADPCAGTIAGGATCTINIDFVPLLGSGEGRRTEAVTFNYAGTGGDAPTSPVSVFGSLGGKALLPLGLSTQSLAPATVDGTPKTATMFLTNRSAASITLTSLVISGAFASDYSRDASSVCVDGTGLGALASCTYVLRFDPPALADRVSTAKLTITHSALGSPQYVDLAGVATPAPQGDIKLDTTPLAFPDTQRGATSTLSRTIKNTGDLALTFSAFTFSGANPSEFERSGTCDTATPLPKTVGECTLTINFRPADVGLRGASLLITSDARTPTVSLTMSGTGIPVPVPLVSLPTALPFDKQTVGGLYPARSVTLTNSGTATLNIARIATQGAAFALAPTGTCGATLGAKASCTIDVAYAATADGTTDNGALVVTSNAAGSPHSVALSGRGVATMVPVLMWGPVAIPVEFGNVAVGTPSLTQSLTLINQGPGGVTLAMVNAVGPNATSFAVVGGTCLPTLKLFEAAPGATTGDGTCTVILQFVPGSAGDKTAQLQVASTGNLPPTMTLHGIGLGGPAPNVALSATAMPFAATRVGAQSLPSEITLTSSGSGSLRVLALATSGPYAVQTKSCPAVPFTLAPNASCTVTVIFTPQSQGASAGVLSVSTDADPATREVALSGNGDAAANVSSGGGCSLSSGESARDPVLWTMVLLALAVLVVRGRERAMKRRKSRGDGGR